MNEISPDLLKRYAEGNCSAQERAAVEEWLDDGDELLPVEGETTSGERVKLEILEGIADQAEQRNAKRRLLRFSIYGLAAACVLILYGILHFNSNRLNQFEGSAQQAVAWKNIDIPAGKRATLTLPEGTVVQLSGRTSFSYPVRFGAGTREVKLLSGQVFFSVHHDPAKPFIVHSNGTEVRVLGTKFDMNNKVNSNDLRVTLAEGRIGFKSKGQQELILKPGQQLLFNKLRQATRISEIDIDYVTGWTTGVLWFKGTPMTEVLQRLEVYYGVTFKQNGHLDLHAPLTGKFMQQPLSRVLTLIENSSDLKFKQEGKEIIVYTK